MGGGSELDDGLIGPPPSHPLGARAFVSMWFLVLTGGLGTWDAIDPPRRPDPLGQEGVHFHNRRLVASVENGTRMRIVDEDLERRSNLNAILTPWYAGALLHTLDEAGHEVVVGEDGWLFLQTRIHPPLGDLGQIAASWANVFEALDRQLRRRGSRLVVMPIPVRAVVCRDRLPGGYDPGPGLWDSLHDALECNDVDTVDLRPAFAEHLSDDLFYREDSHWSRNAQFVAARTSRDYLGSLAAEDHWRPQLTGDDLGPDKQGLLAFAGLPIGALARSVLFPADLTLLRAPLQRRVGVAPGPKDAPLALIGTSYSVGEYFLAYLRVMGTTPVRNGARKGFQFWDLLYNDLRQQRRPSATILVEMMTSSMGPNLDREGELVYMGKQFGFLTALEGRPGPSVLPSGAIVELPSGANIQRLSLESGRLLTSADGIVSVRFQRPVAGTKDWNVVVRGGGLIWNTLWPVGVDSLHLPLVGTTSGSHSYQIDLRGAGVEAVDPNEVRFVLEHDLLAAMSLRMEPAMEPSLGVRIQKLMLEPSWPLSRDLALDYRQGNWSGDVRFELIEAESGTPIEIATGHLEARGRAVLDLATFGSRSWSELRVTTTNVQPGPGRDLGAHVAFVPLIAD
jgi:hypothetical protein